MLITILDGDEAFEYYVNPLNIIGAFRDKVSGGYYIDTVDGNQYQITKESYISVIEWIDELTEKR